MLFNYEIPLFEDQRVEFPLLDYNNIEFHINDNAANETNNYYYYEPINFFRREGEIVNLKELKSNNENFMNEKNIKFTLYPLYINWKKIEKNTKNTYFYVFKLFGYFGGAIFNILKESTNDEDYYNHKNFLKELNFFIGQYKTKPKIEENEFLKKLINIYDDVISLIKNKIMIFKEITVFLIVLRLYEIYFLKSNDNDKVLEVLKYQYIILSYLKDEEYKKIYNKYYKKINYSFDEEEDDSSFFYKYNSKFPKDKKNYINYIRNVFKKINKRKSIKIKEENE